MWPMTFFEAQQAMKLATASIGVALQPAGAAPVAQGGAGGQSCGIGGSPDPAGRGARCDFQRDGQASRAKHGRLYECDRDLSAVGPEGSGAMSGDAANVI